MDSSEVVSDGISGMCQEIIREQLYGCLVVLIAYPQVIKQFKRVFLKTAVALALGFL